MAKELLINVSEGEECRIALLENDRLEELYMERTSSTSHVGNIYKGRVTNVEPSIQAAFIDFGLGRNGFLHISDLMPTYFGRRGDDIQESVGRKMARRDRPPIQRCLRRGDEITVQIIKEGIGTKGPTLTTYLSIPGRVLVMMPGMENFGVSRKIEDEDERRRLRGILDSLDPVEGVGFIIRTAGMGKTKAEIQKDLTYLTRLWQQIQKLSKEDAPQELYTEGDLVTRTVRDLYSADIDRIIVDSKDVAKRIKDFIKLSAPRTKNKVEIYDDPIPLFHKYGIEREIELMNSRHVPLPSGGSLVIDSTEAIVAIDVNSGKFRDHNDAEMTAFKTDMEAADEIPRQLKLRDLGGVIICDFIDLRYERHRRELEHRLHENFKNDRAKTKVLRMSQFGIIELTRQRMRPSLKRSIYCDCPHCKGAGLVKTPESMSLDVMRRLAIAAHDQRVVRVELSVCGDVNYYLQNKKRAQIAGLEADTQRRIIIKQDPNLALDEMKLELFDEREGRVYVEELGMLPEQLEDRGHRHQHNGRRGDRRRDDRHRHDQRHQQQQQRGRHHDEREEQEDRVDQMEESQEQEIVAEANIETPPPTFRGDQQGRAENVEGAEEGGEEQQDGGRRRRRRRGRRGRGRGGAGEQQQHGINEPQDQEQFAEPVEAVSSEEAEHSREQIAEAVEEESEHHEGELATATPSDHGSEEGGESEDGKKKRRRGRRGGRRQRARREAAAARSAGAPKPQHAEEAEESHEAEDEDNARVAATQAIPSAPVVRTGSTDKHQLAVDEDAAEEIEVEEVVERPAPRRASSRRSLRSARDLDSIPDDFDE